MAKIPVVVDGVPSWLIPDDPEDGKKISPKEAQAMVDDSNLYLLILDNPEKQKWYLRAGVFSDITSFVNDDVIREARNLSEGMTLSVVDPKTLKQEYRFIYRAAQREFRCMFLFEH